MSLALASIRRLQQLRAASVRYRARRFGWVTGPPDFVGIGAQRAGTTRWYELIDRHPEVLVRLPKELHFFDRLRGVEPAEVDAEAYQGQFLRAPGRIVGEWTPNYLYRPWCAAQLYAVAPSARLLVIVRDPVERYRSGLAFWHRRPRGDTLEHARTRAVDRGLYAAQLVRYLEHFPASQILVLQHERCVADTYRELRKTFAFLGIGHGFRPRLGRGDVVNPTRTPLPPLDPAERSVLVETYEPDVMKLMSLFPDVDPGVWPNFKHLA